MGKYQFYISIVLSVILLGAMSIFYTPSGKEFMGVVDTNLISYSSKSSGRVAKVLVRAGQAVEAGDVLLQLEDTKLEREIISSKYRLKELEEEINIANGLMENSENISLDKSNNVPSEYREVKEILAILLDTKKSLSILAVSKGIVGEVLVHQGEVVTQYQSLVNVYAKAASSVVGYIHESGVSELKKDDEVIVYSSNGEKKVATGYVENVADRLVEFPLRLKRHTNEQVWGREVYIKIDANNSFLNSEKVLIVKAEEASMAKVQEQAKNQKPRGEGRGQL